MAALAAISPKDDFACVGVRSMQRMRRSQSTSGIMGKMRSKVSSAKEYVGKHGLEAEAIAMKLLTCAAGAGGLPTDFHMHSLQRKGLLKSVTAKATDANQVAVAAKPSSRQLEANHVAHKVVETSSPPCQAVQASRFFYCMEIFTFEEFYNLVGGDHELFDDQHRADNRKDVDTCRYYYGKEIQSYEEFVNLAGGDHEQFDDEHLKASRSMSCSCRHFYGKEIHSYEEFYNLVGGDREQFDDEYIAENRAEQLPRRHFYSREILSYEEFYLIAGGDACFDDEYI